MSIYNHTTPRSTEQAERAADFSVANHGSIAILTGLSDPCRAWIEEHVGNEETQTWGKNGIVVEPRYIGYIVEGLIAEGFTGEAQ